MSEEVTSRHPIETGIRSLPWILVGFGVVALLCAAGVSVYTATAAGRPDCPAEQCSRIAGLSTTISWWLAAAAVVIVAGAVGALVVPSRRRRRLRAGALLLAVCTAGAVLLAYQLSHFTAARNEVDTYLPATTQMWLVTAVVQLVVVGAAAVALGLVPELPKPGGLAIAGITVGAVAAVVVALSMTSSALRFGDDSRYVDATVASAVEPPQVPQQLGQQRFDRTLPNEERVSILPAGAGYVVLTRQGDSSAIPDIVAYDAAGNERWHFRRTGPFPPGQEGGDYAMFVSDVRSYDGGSVLVLALYAQVPLFVGVDAVTGRQLWMSTDPGLEDAVASRTDPRSRFFVARTADHWTAYDPRTGRQTWRIDNPSTCGDLPVVPLPTFEGRTSYPVDTETRLATLTDCSSADQVALKYVSVDPGTGRIIADKPIDLTAAVRRADMNSWAGYAVGGNNVNIGLYLKEGASMDVVQDVETDRSTVFGGGISSLRGQPDGSFAARDGDALKVFAPDAVERCVIPFDAESASTTGGLAQQLLIFDSANSLIRAFDWATCQEVAGVATPPAMQSLTYQNLLPVPGATLLYGENRSRQTSIVGYAP